MLNTTRTSLPEAAGLKGEVVRNLKVLFPDWELSNPTEAVESLTTPSSGGILFERAEHLGRSLLLADNIFLPDIPKLIDSEPSEPRLSRESMLSPERRTILECVREIRHRIGPIPWKISDLLREMEEEE